jgi:hypothetical protein
MKGRCRQTGRRREVDVRDGRIEIPATQVPNVHARTVIAPVVVFLLAHIIKLHFQLIADYFTLLNNYSKVRSVPSIINSSSSQINDLTICPSSLSLINEITKKSLRNANES